MNNTKLIKLIQSVDTFLIGAAFSSAISYDLGLGDWLRNIQPMFMAVIVILLGVWFYISRIKRAP